MAGLPFWGLWLDGTPNDAHVSYVAFARSKLLMDASVYAPLDVDGGHLRVGTGPGAVTGTALEGGILLLKLGTQRFYVKIAEVHSGTADGEPFWTRVATSYAETYVLQWASPDESPGPNGELRYHDVCPHKTLDSDLWHNQVDAVIFEGEKYNLETKEITLTSTADFKAWFNIACAGSTPAKQFLAGRTTASAVLPSYMSAIDNDRQAMVRAWAAEYCGNGINFTQSGHKLLMQDHLPIFDGKGWLPREAPIGFTDDQRDAGAVIVEAVWDQDGAVCLETPRLAVWDPKIPIDPKIEQRIDDGCKESRPPPCHEQSWFPDNWTRHGQLLTAMPLFLIALPE